jgi:hypothetical protein
MITDLADGEPLAWRETMAKSGKAEKWHESCLRQR